MMRKLSLIVLGVALLGFQSPPAGSATTEGIPIPEPFDARVLQDGRFSHAEIISMRDADRGQTVLVSNDPDAGAVMHDRRVSIRATRYDVDCAAQRYRPRETWYYGADGAFITHVDFATDRNYSDPSLGLWSLVSGMCRADNYLDAAHASTVVEMMRLFEGD